MLSKEPWINGEEQVRCSAEVYAKAIEEIEVQKRQDLCEVLERPHLMEMFLQQLHLNTYFGKQKLFRTVRNI